MSPYLAGGNHREADVHRDHAHRPEEQVAVEDEELPETGRVPALFRVFQNPSVPEPDRQRSVQEAGPLGDEGAVGDAREAERREAGVPEGEADGQEDVRGIDQEHADEPALEGEQREGGRGRPDADVKVLGGKGLHLRGAFHQEERHLDHDPLQGDQDEARSEGDSERPFQGDRDVSLRFRHAGAVPSVGLRRQTAGSSPEEAEVPVQHVEEHRADGDAADEGGGAEAARGAQVPGDGDVDHAHQGHGDVREDARNGEAEDVPVEVHRNFLSSSSMPR